MNKKVQWVVVVLIVLLAIGGYWFFTHRPALPTVVEHGPAIPGKSTPASPPVVSPSAVTGTAPAGSATNGPSVSNKPALRTGETLEYAANISKLNSTIANIKIVVGEQKIVEGQPTWHLQAFAHTENPYRMVFELDDQFDSYSEPVALDSLQYEMHLSERGQKIDSIQRLMSSAKDTATGGQIMARVLPGTRDPLGMLHYLRSVDWSKTNEVRSPVYDGRKLYDVRAVLVSKSEAVAVPAGRYSACKIEIHVLDNGTEMKDTHFLLYLTNDAARTPVLLEAVLPIATARVELTKAK